MNKKPNVVFLKYEIKSFALVKSDWVLFEFENDGMEPSSFILLFILIENLSYQYCFHVLNAMVAGRFENRQNIC